MEKKHQIRLLPHHSAQTAQFLTTEQTLASLPPHLTSILHWSGAGTCCSVVSDSLRPYGLYSPWNSLGQNTGVSSLSLL